jgi:glycine cleavage system transcriptional repressor
VITLTGSDRVGIVEEFTRSLLDLGGNVELSRMARLGGEFAVLALVSVPAEKVADIDAALAKLSSEGYRVVVRETSVPAGVSVQGAGSYRVEVSGADHEGIVHEIARGLSELGVNIESMETHIVEAPVTGAPLFNLTALVSVPSSVAEEKWMTSLDEAGRNANVDIEVCSAELP